MVEAEPSGSKPGTGTADHGQSLVEVVGAWSGPSWKFHFLLFKVFFLKLMQSVFLFSSPWTSMLLTNPTVSH